MDKLDGALVLSARRAPTFPDGGLAVTTGAGLFQGGHIGREFTTSREMRQEGGTKVERRFQ